MFAIEYEKHKYTEGPPMRNTVRIPISVLALMLAAPAFSNNACREHRMER
ncbi:hypothetical protein [Burkholderia sp. BCC1972]|nr:hypothetical protein [Burkholderia sp. BCC1972]